jgi:hypothetical protein
MEHYRTYYAIKRWQVNAEGLLMPVLLLGKDTGGGVPLPIQQPQRHFLGYEC